MKTIFLLAVVGLVVAVPKNLNKPAIGAQRALKPRIIGGTEAAPHSRPFQAFLKVYDDTEATWNCGAVVVSNNFLLSAGICGDGGVVALVTLGAHDIYDAGEPGHLTYACNEITVHPDYDGVEIINDIAAFKLDVPVEFNRYIQPVALPSRADAANTFVGEISTVSGWGYEESGGGGELSPVLKVLSSPIVPNSQCEAESNWTIPVSQVCISGSMQTGACNGDIGDPLTVKVDGVDTAVGIFSYTGSLCRLGYPSVFTRITSYLDFVESATDVVIT